MSAPAPAIAPAPGGVHVYLRVAPGASHDTVTGIAESQPGRMAVRLSVTAPPEGGRANAAVIELLARAWRLPKGSLDVVAGGTGRSKILFVAGDTDALMDRLTRWAEFPAR